MRKLAVYATGFAIVAGAVGMSSAAVVFRDDFESYAVGPGAFPQAGLDLDPGPAAPVGNWFVNEDGVVEKVQVTEDFSPVQGTQSLGFRRNGTGAHFTGAQFAASPSTQSDPVKISFKFKDPAPDAEFSGDVDTFNLLGYNKTGGGFANQVFQINLTSGYWAPGTLTVTFGATGLSAADADRADFTGINFDTDWMNVEVLMDFVSHTYTLSVNGNAVANSTNIPFDGDAATANTTQQLAFYSQNSNNTVHAIDDLTIEVIPEPTSLATLALGGGGAALLARRRRVA